MQQPFSQIVIQGRPDFRKISFFFLSFCALLWPLLNADSNSTYQKDLKFGQCLHIDNMTSPNKFGEVTPPRLQRYRSEILQGSFLRSIWTILPNFVKLASLEVVFSKNRDFQDFGLYHITPHLGACTYIRS